MKLLIILNGECRNYEYLHSLSEKFDSIYCADGGYNHAINAGIVPDLVVGDFDSSNKPDGVNTIVYPVEKNDTDSEIAIKLGIENGFSEIVLTCTLGGRCDHLVSNLFMITNFDNVTIDECDCIIESVDEYKELIGFKGKTVSLIPVCESYITLSGFKYSLDDVVNFGTTLTMSNIVVEDIAEIKIKYGKVLLII